MRNAFENSVNFSISLGHLTLMQYVKDPRAPFEMSLQFNEKLCCALQWRQPAIICNFTL